MDGWPFSPHVSEFTATSVMQLGGRPFLLLDHSKRHIMLVYCSHQKKLLSLEQFFAVRFWVFPCF